MSLSNFHLVVVLAVLSSMVNVCHGFFFFMEQRDNKCFIVNTGGTEENYVLIKYKVQFSEESRCVPPNHPGLECNFLQPHDELGVHVSVTGPMGQSVLSKDYEEEGRITFTTHSLGDHHVCFSKGKDTKHNNGQYMKITLSILQGENAMHDLQIEHQVMAMKGAEVNPEDAILDQLKHLDNQLRAINNRVANHKEEEIHFREISESTFEHVYMWAIFELLILASCCAWQLWHLKGFFQSKKMI